VVHKHRHVRGKLNGVVRVGAGQRCEAAAVEIDAVVVLEIGIFTGLHAAGAEP